MEKPLLSIILKVIPAGIYHWGLLEQLLLVLLETFPQANLVLLASSLFSGKMDVHEISEPLPVLLTPAGTPLPSVGQALVVAAHVALLAG